MNATKKPPSKTAKAKAVPTWLQMRKQLADTVKAAEAAKTAEETVAPSPLRTAADIARRTGELVGGDRATQHGDKTQNFTQIAAFWNAYLRNVNPAHIDLPAHAVGDLMELMKIARRQSGAFNEDDYVDAAGYAACAFEVRKEPKVQSWIFTSEFDISDGVSEVTPTAVAKVRAKAAPLVAKARLKKVSGVKSGVSLRRAR